MSAIEANILQTGTGADESTAQEWLEPLNAAMSKFGISSDMAVSAFLANVGVESGSLSTLVENLNYSAQGLANTWPNRYALDPHARVKVPNNLANLLNRNPQAIANNCYANRLGNGSEQSGDGWKYRGQGPIQCTGKDTITAFFRYMQMSPLTDPALLQQPDLGSMSAAWFFVVFKPAAIRAALNGDFAGTVAAVNGQAPCDANNGPLRTQRYEAALAAFT